MPTDKMYEIELEILSVRGPIEVDPDAVTGKLILDDLQTLIRVSEPITFHFSHIDSGVIIQLSLIYLNNLLGNIEFSVGELLQGSATGTSVQDFPFESGYSMVLRVKSDERTNLNGIESITPALECRCPYLHKLSEAHILEEETQIVLDKVKEEIGSFIGDVDERQKSPIRSAVRKAVRSPSKSPTRSTYKRGGLKEEKVPSPEELPEIAIPSRYSINMLNLDKDEIRIMRQVALSMLQKLSLFKIHSDEIDLINQHMERCDKAKHDLVEYMNETNEHLCKNLNTMELFSSEHTGQDTLASVEIQNLLKNIQQLENKIESMREENRKLEEIRRTEQEKQGNGPELDQKLQELTEEFKQIENRRYELQIHFQNSLKEMLEKKCLIEKTRSNGIMEKQRVEIQLNACMSRKDRLAFENVQLNQELESLEAELAIKTVLKQQYIMQQALNEDEAFAENTLKCQLEHLKSLKDTYLSDFNEYHDTLSKEISSVSSAIDQISVLAHEKEGQIFALKDQYIEMNENLQTLDQLMIMKQDLETTLATVQNNTDLAKFSKDKTIGELSWISDYGILQSKGLLTENRLYNKVKKAWDQKKYEIEAIRHSVVEEKAKNPVYFPLKDDVIDQALSDYINSRNEDLIVPFVRESHGVYIFGTKRVLIKYEKSKLTVRIGGGFLPIDDFIDAYGDIELVKFENRNTPLSPSHKKVLGKFVGGLLRSSSPESPTRLKEKVIGAVNNKTHSSAYAVMRPNCRSQSPSKIATPKKRIVSPTKRLSIFKASPNKAI